MLSATILHGQESISDRLLTRENFQDNSDTTQQNVFKMDRLTHNTRQVLTPLFFPVKCCKFLNHFQTHVTLLPAVFGSPLLKFQTTYTYDDESGFELKSVNGSMTLESFKILLKLVAVEKKAC